MHCPPLKEIYWKERSGKVEEYCIYLRKSRADAEAEAQGEGETLARHMKMLTELGCKQKLNVTRIYKEIVSGDSIAARPQMQALLEDVNSGRYSGVLVAEIERLARGDTIDQGIVAQAFRKSSTKIITPVKTYDPDNEFDEEYFEFSLFMSRREYKTINRRMQTGRLASVRDGNYIGTSAPYGYRKTSPLPKIHTLEIIPEEAEVVRLIYRLYLDGHGPGYIAGELDRMGISPQKSRSWNPSSIKKILSNHMYCGMVGWKSKSNGGILYKGLHQPMISEEIYNAVQQKKHSSPAAQIHTDQRLMNCYHGILFCRNCGHQMKRRKATGNGSEHMLCVCRDCRGKTVSSKTETISEAVISALRYRISKLPHLIRNGTAVQEDQPDVKTILTAELEKARRQLARMYDLLEQEIYDNGIFLERSETVSEKIRSLEASIRGLDFCEKPVSDMPEKAVLRLDDVIRWFSSAAPDEKNRLLHAAFSRIDYHKTRRCSRNNKDTDLMLTASFL